MSNNYFRSIEKKILDTENEIKSIENSEIENDIKTLLLSQLNLRKEELLRKKQEMDNLYAKEQIKLIISGDEIGRGEVPVRILADTLSNMMNLVDNIANSIKNKKDKNKRICNDIKESTQFVLKEVFEGSFGMTIEAPFTPDMIDNDNITTNTCKKLFDLLSYGDDEMKLKYAANELGYKTMNAYKEFLSKIKSSKSDIKFEWNTNFGERNIWNSKQSNLRQTISKINSIEIEEEELITKRGKLTKIDISKDEYSIFCEQELLSGKSNFDLLMEIHKYLNVEKEYYFTKKIFKQINTGKEKVEWILTGINKDS